jgi:DNA-binding transcriptional regulator YiaG
MKDIPGYEKRYSITEDGKVWSHPKSGGGYLGYIKKGKWLKTSYSTKYPSICLCDDNKKRKTYLIHRLVAISYLENPEKKKQINHKDGNKLNNNLNNLEWCNPIDNINHAFKTGLNKRVKKLTETQIKEIKKLRYNGFTQVELANMFNVDRTTIRRATGERATQLAHIMRTNEL